MSRSTVIGPGTVVGGPLTCREDVEIAGTVQGPVRGEATVTIAKGARIEGDVRARDVVLAGALEHPVYATGTVRLTATAELRADIEAPRIAIDEGALFEGQVKMVRAKAQSPVTSATQAPPPRAQPTQPSPPRAQPPHSPPRPQPVASTPRPQPGARAIPELAVPSKKRLIRKMP